jgi:uncharacterized protein (TIGR02147 family)
MSSNEIPNGIRKRNLSEASLAQAGLPDIFSYTDYRSYLRDALQKLGEIGPQYSLRCISKKIGLASPGLLSMICSSKRHLSPEKLPQVATVLRLNAAQAEYLELIFLLSRCKSAEDRERILEKIRVCFSSGLFQEMIDDGNVFARYWYLGVLRESVTLSGRSKKLATSESLAESLGLSIEEVEAGFDILLSIGMLRTDEQGNLHRSVPSVHNFGKTNPFLLLNYNIRILEQSIKAAVLPNKRRYFETLTMAIPNELMPEVKTMIKRFFKEVDMLAEGCSKRDQVTQINVQLFSVVGGESEV